MVCKSNGIKPSYYHKQIDNSTYSCYDIIELMTKDFTDPFEAFLLGNAIKYLWRYKLKNGIQDLRKAQEYLTQIILRLEVDGKCKTPTEDGTTHTACAST